MATLEKRSNKICPILIKLAEISYRQFDFKKSESIVDIILMRAQTDRVAKVFGLLMKSHFLSLRAEDNLSEQYLAQAQQLQPGCQLEELDVIKQMRMSSMVGKKPAIMFDPGEKRYVELGGTSAMSKPKFTILPKNQVQGMPSLFAGFLEAIAIKLEQPDEGIFQVFHSFDCEAYAEIFAHNLDAIKATWKPDVLDFINKTNTFPEPISTLADPRKDLFEQEKVKKQNDQKRNLRRKMDHMEHKIKQIKLKHFTEFKDQVLPSSAENFDSHKFEEDSSYREILEMRNLLTLKAQGKQQMQKTIDQEDFIPQIDTACIPDESIIDDFSDLLLKMQGKDVFYVLRNLLRLMVETRCAVFLTATTAVHAFKMYTAVLKSMQKGEQSTLPVETMEQFGSNQVILTMFELSLFNKEVIRQTKSGPIMGFRNLLYTYFEQNEERVLSTAFKQFSNVKCPNKVLASFNVFMVRLFYCMMFFAFEIKSDMAQSVQFHRKLESGKTVREIQDFGIGELTLAKTQHDELMSLSHYLMKENAFSQPWISCNYRLTYEKVTSFGSLKVKEAQMVRDFDQAVFNLRNQDFQSLKKDNQTKLAGEHRVLLECEGQMTFYLEQLFTHLSNTIAQKEEQGYSSEDKIKEMWDKMVYTLCRCPFDRFIKSTCHVLSMLTAFQYLNRQFYDSFVLRRLDFKKLMEEIYERLNTLFMDVQNFCVESDGNFTSLKDQARSIILAKLSRPEYLSKLEVHLLRLFTPEFLQISVNQLLENQSAGESGQIFLRNYFRSLFSIEMLRVHLNYDATKDARSNLKQALGLISCVDKVAQDNFELFIRPYYRLAQYAFPSLLYFFSQDIQNLPQEALLEANKHGQGMYSPQNELTCFVYACINLFFGLKFDLEDLNSEEIEKLKRVVVMEKLEEKKIQTKVQTGIFAFTKFAQARQQAQKPLEQASKPDTKMKASSQDSDSEKGSDCDEQLFGLLLNDARNQVKAQSINQQMKEQQNAGFNLFSGSLLFNQMVVEKGVLRANLMANLITVTDFFTQGRLLRRGLMTPKDLTNCLKLVETLSSSISAHQQTLFEKCKSTKERLAMIKMALKEKPQSIRAIAALPTRCACDKLCFSSQYMKSVSLVVFFLLNIFTHVGLASSIQQVSKLTLQHQIQIAERLQSINDLSKLKALCYTGMQFSAGDEFSLLCFFLSQIQLQFYNQNAESKSKFDFKSTEEYKMSKLGKQSAISAILAALFTSTPAATKMWDNIGFVERLKHFFKQLLQIQLCDLRTKLFVNYFLSSNRLSVRNQPSLQQLSIFLSGQPDMTQSSNPKLQQFIQNTSLTCEICNKFELLSIDSNDPRGKKITIQEKNDFAQLVLKLFTDMQFSAFEQRVMRKEKPAFTLTVSQAQECSNQINLLLRNSVAVDTTIKSVPRSKLSFELAYFEAVLNQMRERDIESSCSSTHFNEMSRLKLVLKTAIDTSSVTGVYESLFRLVQKSIAITLQLRYNNSLPESVVISYNAILTQVSKQILYDKDLQRFMHSQQNSNICDEAIEIPGEESWLFDAHNSHLVRKKIMPPNFNQLDQAEMLLNQLYQFGDKIVVLLSNTASSSVQQQSLTSSAQVTVQKQLDCYRLWLKARFNHMLHKNLYYEYLAFTSTNNTEPFQRSQGWTVISQAVAQSISDVNHIEELVSNQIIGLGDLWKGASGSYSNGFINGFQGSAWQLLGLNKVINLLNRPQQDSQEQTCLLTAFEYSSFSLNIMKFQLSCLYLDMCSKSSSYEPIKEIYKSTAQAFKQPKNLLQQQQVNPIPIDNRGKFLDVIAMFEISKDAYINSLLSHVEMIFSQYLTLRASLRLPMPKAKQVELQMVLLNFKSNYTINGDQVPQYIKDLFELFVDTHNSKQFLKKHEIVNDIQKRAIRQSLLKACSVVGPDSESGDFQVSSKFLDMGRILYDDYVFEGIVICIKWYITVLEGIMAVETQQSAKTNLVKQSSKNQEVHKRLSATLEELQRTVVQAQQMQTQIDSAMNIN